MNFVSMEFFCLFLFVLLAIFVSPNQTWRKLVILGASCIFYAYWDWRFLGLLIFVTVVDYFISVQLHRSQKNEFRRAILALSIFINLSILFYFKYINWFIDTLDVVLRPYGRTISLLDVILPIGISFYIFETISYVIDVYKGVAEPANSLLDYAVFITFFPRLVAGPIMRASQFLPQLATGIKLNWENFLIGSYLFGQGLMKKVVVADSMALVVDKVYSSPLLYSSETIWLGVLSYSIQIYFDFSGYSDMAMGVARVFGIKLPMNFNLPYSAASLSEFWQRWHISLSTWLRDYLYIPLGGNRKGSSRTYVNLMITMLLGGLWHGASWNFVFWGGLHGVGLAIERAFNGNKSTTSGSFQSIFTWLKITITFLFVTFAWVFFRSPSVKITQQIFSKLLFLNPVGVTWIFMPALVYLGIVLVIGIMARVKLFDHDQLDLTQPYVLPLIMTQFLIAFIFSANNTSPFIYFQF